MNWKSGDIVWCKFLHINTATGFSKPDKDGIFECKVKGKSRPVLVLYRTDYVTDVRWYRVLKLTTRGCERGGREKRGFMRLGTVLSSDEDTFAEREPHQFPSNLFDARAGQLERQAIDNLTRIIAHDALRRTAS